MSPKVNSAIIAILDVFDKVKVKNTPRTGVLFLYSSSGSRTLDAGVKNRSLNRLTNEPLSINARLDELLLSSNSSSGSRTLDAGVKNRSLNRLTNEPLT